MGIFIQYKIVVSIIKHYNMSVKKIMNFCAIYLAFIFVFFFQSGAHCQVNLLDDGGFEAGPNGTGWGVFTLSPDPVCDVPTCGAMGAGPHSGNYFVRIDGANYLPPLLFQFFDLYQSVYIPVGNFAQLSFYVEMFRCGNPNDSINMYLDDVLIYSLTGNNPLCGVPGYAFQSVDLSSYADGNIYQIKIRVISYPSSTGQNTLFHIDDVILSDSPLPNTNIITGKLYADLNSNGIPDPGESAVSHKPVTETITGQISYSNAAGNYYFMMPATGNFSVVPPAINYYVAAPATIPVSLPVYGTLDSSNHFAFQPIALSEDLSIRLAPTSPFRAGMDAGYALTYANPGTTTLSPVITFYPDSNVTFQSSNLTPSLVTFDSIQWTPGPLQPWQSGQINVVVHLDSAAAINTLINSTVQIDPVSTDNNPIDNYAGWEVAVTGSFDPNDIQVNRSSLLTTEFPNPPFLDYVIRFQNTGNDTAFKVRIDNRLTEMLDHGSYEFIGASHPLEVNYNPFTRYLQFVFDNILLPDSNINEPESHGYVHYRIKPENNLTIGDIIANSAKIYFDFNQPVVTNTAVTEIVMPLGIDQQSSVTGQRLAVYPNPFRDEITIEFSGMEGQSVTVGIYDICGRLVGRIFGGRVTSDKLKVTSDLDRLSGGIYFVKMESGIGSQNTKIIKY